MRFAEPHWLLIGAVAVALLPSSSSARERLTARALAAARRRAPRSRSGAPPRASDAGCASRSSPSRWPWASSRWRGRRRECTGRPLDRNGTDLLLVVDTSKSMDADDVKPTRLERAKLAIRDLVDRFPGRSHRARRLRGRRLRGEPDDARSRRAPRIARRLRYVGHRPRRDRTSAAPSTSRPRRSQTEPGRPEGDGAPDRRRGPRRARAWTRPSGPRRRASPSTPSASARSPASSFRRGTTQGATVGLVRDESGAPVRSRLDEAGLARHRCRRRTAPIGPLGADGRGLDRLYDESLARSSTPSEASRMRRVYVGVVRGPARAGAPRHRARRAARMEAAGRRSARGGRAVPHLALAVAWPPRQALLALLLPTSRARVGGGRRRRRTRRVTSTTAAKEFEAEQSARTRRTRGSRSTPATRRTAPVTTTRPTPPSSARWRRPIPKLQQQRALQPRGRSVPAGRSAEARGARDRRSRSGRRRSRPTTAPSRSRRRTPTRATTATS